MGIERDTERRADEFVEVYRTDSMEEALRISDVVLVPQGIEAVIHDRTNHALPAPVAQPGVISVAVPAPDRTRALGVIEEYVRSHPESDTELEAEALGETPDA